jgi:hypothetical protein
LPTSSVSVENLVPKSSGFLPATAQPVFAYMTNETSAVICFLAKDKMVKFLVPLPDRSDKRGVTFSEARWAIALGLFPTWLALDFAIWHDVPHAGLGSKRPGKLRTGPGY